MVLESIFLPPKSPFDYCPRHRYTSMYLTDEG
jgi:hypothetical protein